jgi:hypothetical protein
MFIRRLTAADLGLFATHQARIKSRQRALAINAFIADQMLSRDQRKGRKAEAVCFAGSDATPTTRPIKLSDKNWRLGGPRIEGDEYASLNERDFFCGLYEVSLEHEIEITWQTIAKDDSPELYANIDRVIGGRFVDNGIHLAESDPDFDEVELAVFRASEPDDHAADVAPPPPPAVRTEARPSRATRIPRIERTAGRLPETVRERAEQPHVVAEMLRVSAELGTATQMEFITLSVSLAEQLRIVFDETGSILTLHPDHRQFWPSVKGQKIASIDGGLATLEALGSAPLAARVGSYVVTPGGETAGREELRMERQLVDELYATPPRGVFARPFPDHGALRDAARMSLEAGGAIALLQREPHVRTCFTHGALVNPVSRYTDLTPAGAPPSPWPNFTPSAVRKLLPQLENAADNQINERLRHQLGKLVDEKKIPAGQECQFIPVHLLQLKSLEGMDSIVCGVVERPSPSLSVIPRALKKLPQFELDRILPEPSAKWIKNFEELGRHFPMLNDALLLRLILKPGEALRPVLVDRNDIRRAPPKWSDVVAAFPKPHVGYIQATDRSAPIRYELFEKDLAKLPELLGLLLHSARLLPGYAFPVGLNIVDQFAKVPAWMGRSVAARGAARLLKAAFDTNDEQVMRAARLFLTSGARDWYLRPGASR